MAASRGYFVFLLAIFLMSSVYCLPEPGKKDLHFKENLTSYGSFSKTMNKGYTVAIKGKCSGAKKVQINWRLIVSECAERFSLPQSNLNDAALMYLWDDYANHSLTGIQQVDCTSMIHLPDLSATVKELILPPPAPTEITPTENAESDKDDADSKQPQVSEGDGEKKEDKNPDSEDPKATEGGNQKKQDKNAVSQKDDKNAVSQTEDKTAVSQQPQETAGDQQQQENEDTGSEHEADNPQQSKTSPAKQSNNTPQLGATTTKENSGSLRIVPHMKQPNSQVSEEEVSHRRRRRRDEDPVKVGDTQATEEPADNDDGENPPAVKEKGEKSQKEEEKKESPKEEKKESPKANNQVCATKRDGVFMLIVKAEPIVEEGKEDKKDKEEGKTKKENNFELTLNVEMKGPHGYLSASDWPLYPFYGFMSLLYVFYGIVWLIVSACQWRDLLRIQFWIGGVIALGMLEKAVFFSEYNNINISGETNPGLTIFAELVSCVKRTLARILVIIVSMGFGIVKPRLGTTLHRVLGVGALYFILATIEGCFRALHPKADPGRQQLIASIPLAVLDASICWWIFMSLVQTTRTLRIRRNLVKLSLYRHFTNTLIFAVLASVAYMIWSIKTHRFAKDGCITDWSELWLDEAFWHFLFSIVLLVIMVLWRPTANNQRYAFTPIVDFGDDDEDDDNMTLSDAFDGMKMRNVKNTPEVVINGERIKHKPEDDLKWVEENIPSSAADAVLPSVLDSDEELMTTKFEMSKME